MRVHSAPLTVKEAGRKLGVEDEMMKPMLTSAPPAIRSSQDWVGSVAPLKVPEDRLGSCMCFRVLGREGGMRLKMLATTSS